MMHLHPRGDAMGTGSTLVGKEVPIIGSDAVRWIDLSVPSSANIAVGSGAAPLAPPTTDNRASCSAIGDPTTYLIWRIHKAHPQSLELLEVSASKEFPRLGLRFTFPEALCPFAFICKNEISGSSSRFPYLLYVLTVSGLAYLLRIRNVSAYASCSIIPVDELLELDIRGYVSNNAAITAVTATAGVLVIGTSYGSVCCFQLGVLDPSAPGMLSYLYQVSLNVWNFIDNLSISFHGLLWIFVFPLKVFCMS